MVAELFTFISGNYPVVRRSCEEVRKEGERLRAKVNARK